MSEPQEEISELFTQSFAKVLNRHGYGFQFSVLKKVDELVRHRKTGWSFEACEFPVQVQGAGTRVDFVLSRASGRYNSTPLYLIAECKRANPSLSNWCFVRAPYRHSAAEEGERDGIILECVLREDGILKAFAREVGRGNNIYHIGREVRTNVKGDKEGESGQAIEDAATQVSRHVNGFIETVVRELGIIESDSSHVDFMPVIFTTANLYVSDVDLSLADMPTGKVELKTDQVKPIPWLFYQYALSPGLKHSVESKRKDYRSIAELLQWGYLRTIPVVSPAGIEPFLLWASNLDTRIWS
ncbi:MAG TPA: hypothetical protein VFH31_01880 [Pyrinomonadaceae bacterium]|nr:hypothetical protein [Pyrinomonadaceae bacterium]